MQSRAEQPEWNSLDLDTDLSDYLKNNGEDLDLSMIPPSYTTVLDIAISYLENHPSIKKLNYSDKGIYFPAVRAIYMKQGLRQLEELNVSNCDISDTDVALLVGLPNLKVLHLGNCWLYNVDALSLLPYPVVIHIEPSEGEYIDLDTGETKYRDTPKAHVIAALKSTDMDLRLQVLRDYITEKILFVKNYDFAKSLINIPFKEFDCDLHLLFDRLKYQIIKGIITSSYPSEKLAELHAGLELEQSFSKLVSILSEYQSTSDENLLIIQLEKFLRDRWDEIKGTPQIYTQTAYQPITEFCLVLAKVIAQIKNEGKTPYHYLMPTITDFYNPVLDEDMSSLPLTDLVISDDYQHLYPVLTLFNHHTETDLQAQEAILFDPYIEHTDFDVPGVPLSQTTLNRMVEHSTASKDFDNAYHEWLSTKAEAGSSMICIGNELEKLANGLYEGGVHGKGEEMNAAADALCAVSEFSEFLETLNQEEKERLFAIQISGDIKTFADIWRILIQEDKQSLSCTNILSSKIYLILNDPQIKDFLYPPYLTKLWYSYGRFESEKDNFEMSLNGRYRFHLMTTIESPQALCLYTLKYTLETLISNNDADHCYDWMRSIKSELKKLGEFPELQNAIERAQQSEEKHDICAIMTQLAVLNPAFEKDLSEMYVSMQGHDFLSHEWTDALKLLKLGISLRALQKDLEAHLTTTDKVYCDGSSYSFWASSITKSTSAAKLESDDIVSMLVVLIHQIIENQETAIGELPINNLMEIRERMLSGSLGEIISKHEHAFEVVMERLALNLSCQPQIN